MEADDSVLGTADDINTVTSNSMFFTGNCCPVRFWDLPTIMLYALSSVRDYRNLCTCYMGSHVHFLSIDAVDLTPPSWQTKSSACRLPVCMKTPVWAHSVIMQKSGPDFQLLYRPIQYPTSGNDFLLLLILVVLWDLKPSFPIRSILYPILHKCFFGLNPEKMWKRSSLPEQMDHEPSGRWKWKRRRLMEQKKRNYNHRAIQ